MSEKSNYTSPETQEIMNATPQQLMLMLYDGAIGFLNETIEATGENNIEKAHTTNERVQSIIRELMATLDMRYDLSENLMKIYDYMEYRLQSAMLKNDISELKEVLILMSELRDTWAQALPK